MREMFKSVKLNQKLSKRLEVCLRTTTTEVLK